MQGQSNNPVGENLPDKVHVYQYKVVSSFLPGGALLAKIDSFRVLLEESAYSLSGSQHLGDLIPCILDEEKRKVNVIAARHVPVIFDETRHVCEAMVVVLHYNQRVVRLMLLEKSLTVEEVSRQLITTLSTDLGI